MDTIPIELREFLLDKIIPNLPNSAVKVGDKYNLRCPFCGDSKKSATKKRGFLYIRNASYHCFNCDVNMSGFTFASAMCGIEVEELKKEYAKLKYGSNSPKRFQGSEIVLGAKEQKRSPISNLKCMVRKEWKKPLSDTARKYLDGRMVTSAPFLKEPLYTYVSKDGGEYILIPWIINGIECYYQINDFQRIGHRGMKYIFPKDTKKLIYGLDNIDTSFPYIFAFEGVYDSMFVKNGICIGGKSITELQEEILKDRFPRHTVVLGLDNDRPGLISTGRILERKPNLKYFKWFSDSTKEKDINDFILSKKDPEFFSDEKKLMSMVVDPMILKMFLLRKNLWGAKEFSNGSKVEERSGKVRKCLDWKVFSGAS